MPRDWKGPFSRRLQVRASELGKRMANRRWELYRQRRDRLAAITADQFPDRIVKRIVIITNETDVREIVYRAWDSPRECKRKDRQVFTTQTP